MYGVSYYISKNKLRFCENNFLGMKKPGVVCAGFLPNYVLPTIRLIAGHAPNLWLAAIK